MPEQLRIVQIDVLAPTAMAAAVPSLRSSSHLAVRGGLQDRYSLTAEALCTLRTRDITPHEVQDVLDVSPRLTRYVGANAVVVFGITDNGRHLALLALESAQESNDWDVVAARDMTADEIGVFDRCIKRR